MVSGDIIDRRDLHGLLHELQRRRDIRMRFAVDRVAGQHNDIRLQCAHLAQQGLIVLREDLVVQVAELHDAEAVE